MNSITKSIGGICVCIFILSFSAHAQYYPLKLVNYTAKTNIGVHPYIIFMAQDTTTAANYCVLQLTYDPVSKAHKGKLVKVLKSSDSRKYSYCIDSLKGYDTTTKSVNVLIPNTISGRCMVSLNYPLYMPPVLSGDSISWVFQDPNVNNETDMNYDIIFDKFEFTYNKKNILYIDPTAVDFFSLPIGLKSSKESSGPQAGASRDSIMKIVIGVLDADPNKKWDALIIRDSGTIMRIDAPYVSPKFDTSYLKQTSYNYITELIKYYTTHTLRIDCSELNDTGMQIFDKYHVTPAKDPGAYMFTSSYIKNGLWVFKNKPAKGSPIIDTINMNDARSFNFFGPGTYPFVTTNKMVISIIVKNITAAFTVGLLPAPDKMIIDSTYLISPVYPHFKANKQLKAPANSGPWYNLYTEALHAAIPQIYAFAFDDVLGQSGTLVSGDNTDTISIILGDVGNIKIPTHSDLIPVYAPTLMYNSGFVHIGNQYVDTLRWKEDPGQPSTGKYFFMGSGPDFTFGAEKFLSYQYGKFYSAGDKEGWISVPDSLFTNCMNTQIPMSVYSCGGAYSPCPSSDKDWTKWSKAVGSNVMPIADSNIVYPVKATYNSGFTKSGDNYTATIKWTVPANQPASAKYYFMGSNTGFTITPDTFIHYQLDLKYKGQDAQGIVSIPASVFGGTLKNPISIQVLTCGGPGHPCPVKQNISYWSCGIGSNIVDPSKK